MRKVNFPYIAAILGVALLPMIVFGYAIDEGGQRVVPLLSLLVMNEFALIAAGFGVYIGVQQIRSVGFQALYVTVTVFCACLLVAFILLAIKLWPL